MAAALTFPREIGPQKMGVPDRISLAPFSVPVRVQVFGGSDQLVGVSAFNLLILVLPLQRGS